MPNVMIRRDNEGKLTLYVAKRDLEENIVSKFLKPYALGVKTI